MPRQTAVKKTPARAAAKPAAKKSARPAPKKAATPAKAAKPATRKSAAPAKAAAPKRAVTAKPKAVKPAPVKPAAPEAAAPKPAPAAKPALQAVPTPKPTPAAAPTPVAAPAPVAPAAAPPRAPALAVAPARPAAAPQPPRPAQPAAPRADLRFGDLTESALLAMPPDAYMNEAQLAFFKAMLLDMKRELEQNAGVTSEHLRENEVVPDPADRATIEEEHALELRTRDRERKLMKKVDQALRRIEDGSYGWCEETGEPIGLQRLLARPTATLSVEAQARRELKQKMYGD